MRVVLVTFNGLGRSGRYVASLAPLILEPIAAKIATSVFIADAEAMSRTGTAPYPSENYPAIFAKEIVKRGDILCFSTRSDNYPLALEVAATCKAESKGCTIIFGGPQATATDLETISTFDCVDVIVRSEGEESFRELLSALRDGSALTDIAGITIRSGREAHRTPDRPLIPSLDASPTPNYEALVSTYPDIDIGFNDMELGRGCPFKCNFCLTTQLWRQDYRNISPETLLDRAYLLKQKYGTDSISFIHDNVILTKNKYAKNLINTFNGHGFKWSLSTRIDTLDIDLIPELAAAGLGGVFFGIETGADIVKQAINKRFPLATVENAVRRLSDYGIRTTLSFIVGFPEEAESEIWDTVSFAIRCAAISSHAYVQIHALSLQSGTPLFQEKKDRLASAFDPLDVPDHAGNLALTTTQIKWINEYPDIFSAFYKITYDSFDVRWLYKLQSGMPKLLAFFPKTLSLIFGQSDHRSLEGMVNLSNVFTPPFSEFDVESMLNEIKAVARDCHAASSLEEVLEFESAIFEATISAIQASADLRAAPDQQLASNVRLLETLEDPDRIEAVSGFSLNDVSFGKLMRAGRSYFLVGQVGPPGTFDRVRLTPNEFDFLKQVDEGLPVEAAIEKVCRANRRSQSLLSRLHPPDHWRRFHAELSRRGFIVNELPSRKAVAYSV